MAFLRAVKAILFLFLAAAFGIVLLVAVRDTPRRAIAPDPAAVGLLTAGRLAGLGGDPPACRALLDRAGISYRPLNPRRDGPACGYADGIAWRQGGARETLYAPRAPALACPLAAALAMWEWDVVQPAAARAFGTTVAEIDHYGSYACRRLYGRAQGNFSEHARGAAIDIAGFRLSDGRRITVARDWRGAGPEARFLHAVRDGGCRLFATTLSPDYNAAHRDHLHLDEARRGGSVCR